MILMNNTQILSAVVKGLEENIAPELQTDYAQVQLLSAIKAVQEVISRLNNGDPCIVENGRLEKFMLDLASEVREESPELAAALEEKMQPSAAVEDPRERNRVIKLAIWEVIRDSGKAEAQKVLKRVMDNHMATLEADSAWICPEAVKQLS